MSSWSVVTPKLETAQKNSTTFGYHCVLPGNGVVRCEMVSQNWVSRPVYGKDLTEEGTCSNQKHHNYKLTAKYRATFLARRTQNKRCQGGRGPLPHRSLAFRPCRSKSRLGERCIVPWTRPGTAICLHLGRLLNRGRFSWLREQVEVFLLSGSLIKPYCQKHAKEAGD